MWPRSRRICFQEWPDRLSRPFAAAALIYGTGGGRERKETLMKKHLQTIICVLLAAACLCLTAALVLGRSAPADEASSAADSSSPANGTVPGYAASDSSDIQFRLALLHLYKEASDVVLALPFTTITLTQTAVTRSFIGSGEASAALSDLNERVDRTLNSAFETMDDITAKFSDVLKEYAISSTSSYYTKLNSLKTMFSSLKNSSTELISRTRSFINMIDGDYDAYYTNYLEQLSDLSGKIESYGSTLGNEYDALLSSISDSYETIK